MSARRYFLGGDGAGHFYKFNYNEFKWLESHDRLVVVNLTSCIFYEFPRAANDGFNPSISKASLCFIFKSFII